MFYCFITILSTIFYDRLICLSFVIEIFNFQTVPGTKQHRFMFNLTFYAMPSFFRHQKDSGSWSIYKGENFFNENCILRSTVVNGNPASRRRVQVNATRQISLQIFTCSLPQHLIHAHVFLLCKVQFFCSKSNSRCQNALLHDRNKLPTLNFSLLTELINLI